jgi:hypothetical protein
MVFPRFIILTAAAFQRNPKNGAAHTGSDSKSPQAPETGGRKYMITSVILLTYIKNWIL